MISIPTLSDDFAIDTSKAKELEDRLSKDPELKQEFIENPKEVLDRFGIEISDELVSNIDKIKTRFLLKSRMMPPVLDTHVDTTVIGSTNDVSDINNKVDS